MSKKDAALAKLEEAINAAVEAARTVLTEEEISDFLFGYVDEFYDYGPDEEFLEEPDVLRLSPEAFEIFKRVLDAPPSPNERLRSAVARWQDETVH